MIWHDDNHTGTPGDVMGSSPLFPAREDAVKWVLAVFEEERERAAESEDTLEVERIDEDMWRTDGNCQTCWYKIEEVRFGC